MPPATEPSAEFSLSILGADGTVTSTVALPRSGDVLIGRADDCFVRLPNASVSRQHARLRLGASPEITDLDSGNGTRLHVAPGDAAAADAATRRTEAKETALVPGRPYPLRAGQIIRVGSVALVLKREEHPEQRWWSAAKLQRELDQACREAMATGGTVSLLRVRVDDGAMQQAKQVVAAHCERADLLAESDTGELDVLVTAGGRGRALELMAALDDALRGRARTALAHCPENGDDAHALLSHCASKVGHPATATRSVVVGDPKMQELHATIRRVGPSNVAVAIFGETGVGKELVAEAVHRASPRAEKPFFCLNCGALSESLLESELFGHERGAFTGASRTKQGILEAADGGTVFLDEIGELPLPLQVKLLRVLESGAVLRVGATKPRGIDVRFISATNRDLEAEVKAGRFRADLYFRVAGVVLRIPPLRERPGELAPLAQLFLSSACRALGRWPEPSLSEEAQDVLRAHSWPGNVRELRNVMDSALLACDGERIFAEHLPRSQMAATSTLLAPDPAARATLPPAAADDERGRIVRALEECAGNQTRAAKMLGISRRTLVSRLAHYNLRRPRKKP